MREPEDADLLAGGPGRRALARLFYRWEVKLAERDKNRRSREFSWGTDFIGGGPLPGHPRQLLLEHARAVLRDSEAYHFYEPVTDFSLDHGHLTFTSPLLTACASNNTVHAWHFPVSSRGRVVLVLPQWNSDAQGHMALCRLLNRFGLSALRLSLPYHDLRMPEELQRADYMISPNLGRTLHAVRQAVMDARAALDWLESAGYERFAVLGTSLGSCIALITQAHDRRLQVSVLNHVSTYFADVVWTGLSTRHVRAGLEKHVDLADLREIWMPISPRAYFPRMTGTGKSSLLIHARFDYSFLPRFSRQVLDDYRRLGIPHSTLALPCGHYTSGEFPFNIGLGLAMCNYLRKHL
jgi:hypothetical protein